MTIDDALGEHLDRLYATARVLAGNAAHAEDLAQETAIAAFKAWGQLRSHEAVRPWLLRILMRTLLNSRRYDSRRPPIVDIDILGETIRVRFTNNLPQDTTIHWHGVRLPNAMDGVPYITQQPVPPGGTFTYELTPKDAGTFWFHPHVRASEQVERGLYGVLVVEDAKPPPYSRELVWVLDDWLLDATGQIATPFNTRHDLAMDGRWGNAITIDGLTDTVLKVQPGERIRVRLLNTANGRVFMPDFGDLDAKIIAVDGLYLRAPIPARGFEFAPGNRLDIDLSFDRSTSAPLEIWDRFFAQRPNKLARIQVEGELVQTPAFPSPATTHIPRWSDAVDAPIAHDFRLNAPQGVPGGPRSGSRGRSTEWRWSRIITTRCPRARRSSAAGSHTCVSPTSRRGSTPSTRTACSSVCSRAMGSASTSLSSGVTGDRSGRCRHGASFDETMRSRK